MTNSGSRNPPLYRAEYTKGLIPAGAKLAKNKTPETKCEQKRAATPIPTPRIGPLRKKEEPEQVQCTRQGHKNYHFGQNPDLLDLFSGAKPSRFSRGLAYLPWLRVHHIFLLTSGIGSEKTTFVSSLRRHYPDQVQ